jgi:hypothetical protein
LPRQLSCSIREGRVPGSLWRVERKGEKVSTV